MTHARRTTRLALTVRDDDGRIGTDDLRRWLGRQRELHGCVNRGSTGTPDRGTMGTATELVTVFLAPGGVATVLAAAVVAWVQNRRGTQTVTITRPDGTEVTVTSEGVKNLTAQQVEEARAEEEAQVEEEPRPDAGSPDSGADGRRP